MPCKGIECGEMGPKLGWGSKENGWCIFKNVRIPRANLLSKFISVDREGSFSIEGDLRVLYATMMSVRTQLLESAAFVLNSANVIAIRYSCV